MSVDETKDAAVAVLAATLRVWGLACCGPASHVPLDTAKATPEEQHERDAAMTAAGAIAKAARR